MEEKEPTMEERKNERLRKLIINTDENTREGKKEGRNGLTTIK